MLKDVVGLCLTGVGMAVAIGCNSILASMFSQATLEDVRIAISLGGVLMLCITFAFARLMERHPGTFGPRSFTLAAFGDRASRFIVFSYLLTLVTMGALEVHLCFSVFRTQLSAIPSAACVLVVVGGTVMANIKGHRARGRLQNVSTLIVLALILGVSWFAIGVAPPQPPGIVESESIRETSCSLGTVLRVTPVALFLFVGVEWSSLKSGSSQRAVASRNIAILSAIVVVAVAYLVFSTALAERLSPDVIAKSKLPAMTLALDTGITGGLIALVSLFALVSSINVGLDGASRLVYSMAREGLIPRSFAKLDIPSLVPRRALMAVVGSVLLVFPAFFLDDAIVAASELLATNLVLVYAATVLAWIRCNYSSLGLRRLAPFVLTLGILVVSLVSLVANLDGGTAIVISLELGLCAALATRRG